MKKDSDPWSHCYGSLFLFPTPFFFLCRVSVLLPHYTVATWHFWQCTLLPITLMPVYAAANDTARRC